MTAYRDRPMACPRCTVPLVRSASRDVWGCPRCTGVLASVSELITELAAAAPALVPESGPRNLRTFGRHTKLPPLTCPSCAGQMEPVFLAGVDVDRCYHDEQLWLDAGEPALILDRAQAQIREEQPWFTALIQRLFG